MDLFGEHHTHLARRISKICKQKKIKLMKLIILHPDKVTREILCSHVRSLDHAVVHASASSFQIMHDVAKHRPHLVLADEPELRLRAPIQETLEKMGLHVHILWIPALSGDDLKKWASEQLYALRHATAPRPLSPYTADQRLVIRDDAYGVFEDGLKRNFPEVEPENDAAFAHELATYARHVEGATAHHAAAQHHLHQVIVTDQGLRVEATYRAIHSSHKIFWLREHIFRWIGVLAHYLPGVELEYLPPPAPPSPKLDYLHYSSPPESCYAAAALLIHGFKPSWMLSLRSILEQKFIGQDEETLLQETLTLAGWSFLLREIAIAQVRVMHHALKLDPSFYTEKLPARALHRATGIYCDFWNLRYLRTNPHLLIQVAKGVVKDRIRVPDTVPVVPHFHQFLGTTIREMKGQGKK